MKGLDTNVLIGWLLANASSEPGDDGPYFISSVVLAELVWVMRTTFGNSRERVATTLDAILHRSDFRFANRTCLLAALDDYRTGPADFPDYMILQDALAHGCATVLTSDKKAGRHPAFTLTP